jgi:hypothetical protein
MEYKRVSYEFSQEELDGFKQDMNSIRVRIESALVILNPELRRRLKTIGNRMHPFVEQSLDYVKTFPNLAPANFDVNEFQRDWNLTIQTKSLLKEMEALVESIFDIYLGAGGDALAHARNFYGSTKNAAKHGVANAVAVDAELSQTYKKGKLKPEEEELVNTLKNPETPSA